jgi:hypothetical protein
LIRKVWRRVRRAVKWTLIAVAVITVLLLVPVAYVEVACRGDGAQQTYQALITDPAFQRREANTYLTYPEWHIVFAYDGLAHALKTGDEYAFDYFPSISRFWSSACTLTRVAGQHGGADWGTRSMIHTIGVSFTAEMTAKAFYEETIGRMAAWVRGPNKTPQDRVVVAMASDYAAFLRQTPWYMYPFDREVKKLWAAPVDQWIRGWERRVGIGIEFKAKAAYAQVIAQAVAATGEAQLVIRTVVSGLDASVLSRMPDVKVIGSRDAGVEIETPRYDIFTRLLVDIAKQGGVIREIAGNDEIMVSLIVPEGATVRMEPGVILLRMKRDGIPGDRILVNVKVSELATFLTAHPPGDPGLEHVFDY